MRQRGFAALAILMLAACSSTPTASSDSSGSLPESSAISQAQSDSDKAVAGASHDGVDKATVDAAESSPVKTVPANGAFNDPPKVGTYTYRQDGSMTYGALKFDFDPEGSFEVQEASKEDGATRQVTIRRYAESRERETITQFRSDAILLEETIERVGSGATQQVVICRTPEPIPVLPIPWRVGSSWKGSGKCNGFALEYTATLRKVENRVISGEELRTLVIDATYEIKGTELSQSTSATIWFSPDHRLIARQVEKTQGSYRGTPFARELTEELVSPQPA